MEDFWRRTYTLNFYLLKITGLWPFDSPRQKILKRLAWTVILFPYGYLIYIRFVEELSLMNMTVLFEIILNNVFFQACCVKYMVFVWLESEMQILFKQIAEHWEILALEKEQKILRDYTEEDLKWVVGYVSVLNVSYILYFFTPLTPVILNVIKPLNESRARQFPVLIEYFVDEQKYYYQLASHVWFAAFLATEIYCAWDTTFVIIVRHARPLFATVEWRVMRATTQTFNAKYASDEERDLIVYRQVVNSILLHQRAIKYVNFIESSYSIFLAVSVLVNTLMLTVVPFVSLLHIENRDDKQAIRVALLYFSFLFHLAYHVYPGQYIIDSSANVHRGVLFSEWFKVCRKTKKLICMMILRSINPCKLTAGNLIALNLESFVSIVKASVTYVTVLKSVR